MAKLEAVFHRALDTNADPGSGGLLYVFEAGTTTPVVTYSDSALSLVQSSPVVADSAGIFADTYVPGGSYKVRIQTSGAVTLYETDNILISSDADTPVVPDLLQSLISDIPHSVALTRLEEMGALTFLMNPSNAQAGPVAAAAEYAADALGLKFTKTTNQWSIEIPVLGDIIIIKSGHHLVTSPNTVEDVFFDEPFPIDEASGDLHLHEDRLDLHLDLPEYFF